ncbi:uncharacterized protein LOC144122128 [Amblyomma americanum]
MLLGQEFMSNFSEMLLEFVRNQKECKEGWHAAEVENSELKTLITTLTKKNLELKQQSANAREALKREQLRREKCEKEVEVQKKQLEVVREFLEKKTKMLNNILQKLPLQEPGQEAKLHRRGNRLEVTRNCGGSMVPSSGGCFPKNKSGHCGANSTSLPEKNNVHGTVFKRPLPVAKKEKGIDKEQAHIKGPVSKLQKAEAIKNGKKVLAPSRAVNQPVTPCQPPPLPTASVSKPPCCPTAGAPPRCLPTKPKFTSGQ